MGGGGAGADSSEWAANQCRGSVNIPDPQIRSPKLQFWIRDPVNYGFAQIRILPEIFFGHLKKHVAK